MRNPDSTFEMTASNADSGKTTRALKALLDLTKSMSSAIDLDTLLDVIVHNASSVVEAERTTIFLYDSERRLLSSRVAQGLSIGTIEVPLGSGIVGHVAQTLEVALIADAYADARFNQGFDRSTGYRTKSVLCAPIVSGAGRLLGVIQSINKTTAETFEAHDEALIVALASHVAVAIERAHLTELHFENERLEEALKLASEIQLRMLPPATRPSMPGDPLELVAHIRPAKRVGGDFYDYFAIDESHLCLCIGDVSGKGIGAALLMAVTKTLFRANAIVHRDPAALMSSVNMRLHEESDPSMFVTAFCAIVDARSGEMQHCNAGHNAPLVVPADGPAYTLDSKPGIALGVLPKFTYKAGTAVLDAGSALYLFTDGVTEAANLKDELFMEERLREVLDRCSAASASSIVEQTLSAVDAFAGSAPQSDDITMMCLRYQPSQEEKRVTVQSTALFKRDIGLLEEVFAFIGAYMLKENIDPGVRFSIDLAVEEVFTNFVKYNRSGLSDIEVTLLCAETELRVTLTDFDSPPYDLTREVEVDINLPLDERQPGGLGVHLVKKLMDRVEYEYTNRESRITLYKRLDQPCSKSQ